MTEFYKTIIGTIMLAILMKLLLTSSLFALVKKINHVCQKLFDEVLMN